MQNQRSKRNLKVIDYAKMNNQGRQDTEADSDSSETLTEDKVTPTMIHDCDDKNRAAEHMAMGPTTSSMQSELYELEQQEQRLKLSLKLEQKRRNIISLREQMEASGADTSTATRSASSSHTAKPTLSSLAQDKELQAALRALHTTEGPFFEEETATAKEGTGSPYLAIPDHVNQPASTSREQDKVKKDKEKKMLPEEVTVPQWISANVRILIKLKNSGMTLTDVLKYLKYTAKIGDYLQVSETPSVMVLDNDHRQGVAQGLTSWDIIDQDKRYFFLEKSRTANKPFKKNVAQRDPQGRPICLKFNGAMGCNLSFCRFSHVCSTCFGEHPRLEHTGNPSAPNLQSSVPPRFRPT